MQQESCKDFGGVVRRGFESRRGASGLYALVTKLEADLCLYKPRGLRSRIQALDELDAYFGDGCTETSLAAPEGEHLYRRARAMQLRMESLNSAAYRTIHRTIRNKIRRGVQPERLWRWIRMYGYDGAAVPGLGYDDLDELISGVLALQEPDEAEIHHRPEMVFYQSTPVRHIFDLIKVSALSAGDVLVDLGCGLGHVPMLTSIMTESKAIGIELQNTYIESARECAERLCLSRVEFLQQDARDADLSAGNVFYLYTPFTGTILKAVVAGLKREAKNREIRVCTLGPCISVVANEPWLTPTGTPVEGRITCFSSTAQL